VILKFLNTKYDYQNNEEHDAARLVEALRYTTELFIDIILPAAH